MHNMQDTLDLQYYAYRIQKPYKNIVYFVDQCKCNFKKTRNAKDYCEYDDIVTIKLDAYDNLYKQYISQFNVHFLNENTLIVDD